MSANVVSINTRGNNNQVSVGVHPAQAMLENTANDPLANWDSGLPRTFNPYTGKDDTEARKKQCEDAYKLRHYNTPEQVRTLRRGLYSSIHRLRTQTYVGYQLDKTACRTPYKSVLQ